MEKINQGFDNLKKLLPPPDRKLSKAAILQQAVQHIKLLQRTVVQIKMENQDLKRCIETHSTSGEPDSTKSSGKIQTTYAPDELEEEAEVTEMILPEMQLGEGKIHFGSKQSRVSMRGLSNFPLNKNYSQNWPSTFYEKRQKIAPNLKHMQCFKNDHLVYGTSSMEYSIPAHFSSSFPHSFARSNNQKSLPALSNYKRIAPYPCKSKASLQSLEKSSTVPGRAHQFQSTLNKPDQSTSNRPRFMSSLRRPTQPACSNLDTIIEAIQMIENKSFER